eukprot:3693081-Prymnesium_polylepis.1
MSQRFFPCDAHQAAVAHRTIRANDAGARYAEHTTIYLQVPQQSGAAIFADCLLYTSPSPRDAHES